MPAGTRIVPKYGRARSGSSLLWILFPSIVFTIIVIFMAVQALEIVPNVGPSSFWARMNPHNLAREASESLPLLLLILGLMMAGVFVALRVGLRPLRRISEQASEIGPATINRRLPLRTTPKEIAPLVVAFNATLERLEAGLRAQREFSANAAHELRTPLATLRAQVEGLLAPDDLRQAIEEFDRLSRLISQLLALAEADDAEDRGDHPFDLVDLARTVTGDLAGAIVARGQNIAFESQLDQWRCHGVPGLVGVAIRNLLENAMRHAPPGSDILVLVDGEGRLRVQDNGPGVPERFRERLFERFSKADAHSSGAGLGLSIVRRIMRLHAGDAWLEPMPRGACFVLDFSARCRPDAQQRVRTMSRS